MSLQGRVSANGRVGATSAVYSAAILGKIQVKAACGLKSDVNLVLELFSARLC